MANVKRLYEKFQPTNYDIDLTIDPEALTFQGLIVISGKLIGDSDYVSLHSKDLDIVSADVDGKASKPTHHSQDELRLNLDGLKAGNKVIKIEFKGEITETMHGIYTAPHTNGSGMMIATQFESHHAREAFPCVDEPMAKATFELQINTPDTFTVLSNMPVAKKGKNQVHFEKTPIMSSYLLAFIVGEIKSISGKAKDGTEVSVWATPDLIEHCEFALDVGIKGLDFFSEYFDVHFPLPKCDFIGVPSFSAGAMENWGLITFRESALIVDKNNTSLPRKQRVTETIIHELAHQWFGNLVTMNWWNDLWLNEGFASWAANFGVDKLFPDWKYWSQFIASDFTFAQSADSLPSTRPIEVTINDPEEIRSIFDEISYSKGPVIVRMLHQFLGDDDFRKGLKHYFEKHEYGNASTTDLWNALEEHSGKPVAKLMSAWTSQAGFPSVKATFGKDEVELEQSQFLITGKKTDSLWPIPITATNDESFLLDTKEATWKLSTKDTPKLNANQESMFMVDYDHAYWQKLTPKIVSGEFDEIDRMGLLNDNFQLAKAGKDDIIDGLTTISKLGEDESLIVWEIITGQLSSIRRVMDSEELIDNMRPLAAWLSQHNLIRLGWEVEPNEATFDTMLRPLIIGLAGFGNDESVKNECFRIFKDANKPEDIEPDMRSVVYGVNVRFGDVSTYEKLLDFYNATASPQEKQLLSSALTGFRQEELINRSLEMIKTDVKIQDAGFWFAYGFSSRYAKQITWDWVKDNWDWIIGKFKHDIMTLSWIPDFASRAFSTQEFLDEYQEFFMKHHTKSIERSINKGIESLRWQIAWRDRDFEKIDAFFKK